jgi:hypothetical protein
MKMGSINHWVKKEQERVEDGSLFARILSSFFIQFMKMAKEKGEKINKNIEIFSVESSHYTSKHLNPASSSMSMLTTKYFIKMILLLSISPPFNFPWFSCCILYFSPSLLQFMLTRRVFNWPRKWGEKEDRKNRSRNLKKSFLTIE